MSNLYLLESSHSTSQSRKGTNKEEEEERRLLFPFSSVSRLRVLAVSIPHIISFDKEFPRKKMSVAKTKQNFVGLHQEEEEEIEGECWIIPPFFSPRVEIPT